MGLIEILPDGDRTLTEKGWIYCNEHGMKDRQIEGVKN